jgi:hypothetical protein
MLADGLLDTLEAIVAMLAVVVILAVAIHRSSERYAEARGERRRRRGLPDTAPWTCPTCGMRNDGPSRFCDACKSYPTIADDPGSEQMMWFMGWLPALVAAAIGGIVAVLITWEPWPLLIALLAGPLLGWIATLVFFYSAGRLWWRYSRDEGMAGFVVITSWIGVGPAVAVIVTIVVTLGWV